MSPLMPKLLFAAYMARIIVVTTDVTAVYDNSGPFEEYLSKIGMQDALDKAHLQRKTKHTIHPPVRLCTLLNASGHYYTN